MKISIVGLGYVGLPLAIEFGKKYQTIGFDTSNTKISSYKRFIDINGEVKSKDFLKAKLLSFTNNPENIKHSDVFIIAVPTPVDENNIPDLTPSAPYLSIKVIGSGEFPSDLDIFFLSLSLTMPVK